MINSGKMLSCIVDAFLKKQKARKRFADLVLEKSLRPELALAHFHAGIFLVDDVNAAFAADNAIVPVAGFEAFQRINDFHG